MSPRKRPSLVEQVRESLLGDLTSGKLEPGAKLANENDLAERFEVSPAVAASIRRAHDEGRPIVAVGTTVVRALETLARRGPVAGATGATDLLILPGDRFQLVTDLVTNFHLPKSSLLMLVSAFAGRERVLSAYGDAIARGYRFYSYGDAMFIRPGKVPS